MTCMTSNYCIPFVVRHLIHLVCLRFLLEAHHILHTLPTEILGKFSFLMSHAWYVVLWSSASEWVSLLHNFTFYFINQQFPNYRLENKEYYTTVYPMYTAASSSSNFRLVSLPFIKHILVIRKFALTVYKFFWCIRRIQYVRFTILNVYHSI
jgi:hypothetical protein